MKEFDPKREFLFDYITVVAECTFAIAVIGSLFARNNSISFIYFFLPFGLAFICMIPCIPIYLKEDMTIPQIMWQRGIELVVLEIAMCAVIYLIMGDSVSRMIRCDLSFKITSSRAGSSLFTEALLSGSGLVSSFRNI